MTTKRYLCRTLQCLGVLIALFAAGYAAYVGITWLSYGHARSAAVGQATQATDPLLDSLLPQYDVAGRQHLHIAAPPQIVFSAGCNARLEQSPIVRTIFKTRALLLGAKFAEEKPSQLGLVDQAKAWGWGMLAENPGREIVFGAVTQPWSANPVFRALPPDEFAKFHEPGFVKIAWMLRVDPIDSGASLATETRVATTDAASYAKFRRYWSWASPGMFLIRWVALREARDEAERQSRLPVSTRGGIQ